MDVFSVKKVLLGGAAVTATVLLVMSTAWACSPYANRWVSATEGRPGDTILIEGSDYEPQYGTVTVELTNGSNFGILLDTPTLVFDRVKKVEDKTTKLEVEISVYRFTSAVTVPVNRKPGYDYIDVVQQSSAYGIKKSTVFTVQASESSGSTTTTQPRPTTTLGTVPPTLPTPTTRALAPGSQTGPTIGAVPDFQRSAGPGALGGPVDGSGAAALASEEPAGRAEAKVGVGPQFPPPVDPERDMQTLWSGLEKSDANAATLTGPTEPPDGPNRLGPALLALGGLLLLTGGLVAAPRRRALRRIR